jgi:hypothetical protein
MTTIQIFVLFIHLTFQDGTTDQFWPAFMTQEECQHFATHVQEFAELSQATLENDLMCTPALIAPKPPLSEGDKGA